MFNIKAILPKIIKEITKPNIWPIGNIIPKEVCTIVWNITHNPTQVRAVNNIDANLYAILFFFHNNIPTVTAVGNIIPKYKTNVGSVVYISIISIGVTLTIVGIINISQTKTEHPPIIKKIELPFKCFKYISSLKHSLFIISIRLKIVENKADEK